MRIAFVSVDTIHHRSTETNERFQTVLELLRDHGHDVHLFCTRFWPGERRTLERDGIVYHGVAADRESPRSFYSRLPLAIRRLGPDVIHARAEPPGQVLAASTAGTLARAPLLVEWYGDGGVPDDRWHRLAASRSPTIVTPSRLVETWIRERGASDDQVAVIPTPIDLERIRATDPGEATDVVYARRLDEEANLESLLLALAELRQREWTATVVGDGPERERYEELTEDLRLADRVTFAGDVSRDERLSIYRSARVFVQTATHCVFPEELLWALASGCVGVVEYHAASSAHELVEGRERGFRTTSEEELTSAIVEAGRLEHRDYEPAFESFGRRPVSRRYLEAYRELQAASELL
ncbi:glycosyltransferase [Natrononativus amylolyticus]|uniref:glycosyltransferase n=1 Tax=Natrononativus amylolyticus TaxID=2963434 RepID=UPI0020CF46C9|nr:glycosyltransferase [Natrononativus amylolyticus]